ncbi:hypothetical protein K6Y31_17605 [Motilimonas cestriensis]|uniref:Uncharacterized protein n=1 Tax=Motilimonas cestriensis TaxID=2742685 RepID=A0ABS8WEQ1_9GAMM|nr:hypothetical protein [Motilimonas cestriensis]MCE2596607.1 hypothetical protein [Motilimonas cestriensis]
MGISDNDYVNFSQDHELDYHLRKVSKRQTDANRKELKQMGEELKKLSGKTRLLHNEFHPYVDKNKFRLE